MFLLLIPQSFAGGDMMLFSFSINLYHQLAGILCFHYHHQRTYAKKNFTFFVKFFNDCFSVEMPVAS